MKILSNESSGTYLLRMNEEGQLRISFKKGHKVEHIRVVTDENKENFWIQRHEDQRFLSIRRLVEGFVRDEKKIISKPLLSAFRDRPARKIKSGDICLIMIVNAYQYFQVLFLQMQKVTRH